MPLTRYNDQYVDDPHRKMQFYEDFEEADFPLLSWLAYWLSGDRKQDRQADEQRIANAENMELELEMQKRAATDVPAAQMAGLQNAGVSASAAAAALAGGASVNAPAFSSGGASTMPANSMLNGIFDLIPALLQ